MHLSFLKTIYFENEGQRPVLDEVEFSTISEDVPAWLDRPFEEEEVYGVIQGCNGDKSSGPNCFSMSFFLGLLGLFKTWNYGASFKISFTS